MWCIIGRNDANGIIRCGASFRPTADAPVHYTLVRPRLISKAGNHCSQSN